MDSLPQHNPSSKPDGVGTPPVKADLLTEVVHLETNFCKACSVTASPSHNRTLFCSIVLPMSRVVGVLLDESFSAVSEQLELHTFCLTAQEG
eukprot:2030854-Amphidinium_carterae.1